MPPIRSPRQVYKITQIKVGEAASGAGGTPIYLKMKESVGDFLGLEPMAWDDPEWTGVFAGGGLNQGYKYRKNLGGFRHASFKLVAKTIFNVTELISDDDGNYNPTAKNFKSISIGFPRGWSVHEVIIWLSTFPQFGQIKAIVTPAGRRVVIGPATQ